MTSVRLATSLGTLTIDADTDRAPVSAGDFLHHAEHGNLAHVSFLRAVDADNDQGTPPISILQAAPIQAVPDCAPIAHESTTETGLRHRNGAVSLARGEPGTASGLTFFVCLGDQSALDAGGARLPDGLGFAAFGAVTSGVDVVRSLHARPRHGSAPVAAMEGQILTDLVPILAAQVLR